ncbi:MAG: response regulator [Sterolibacteriaceae bacterium]|nr:response regulator [Sterolibacteriaceae bacterium]
MLSAGCAGDLLGAGRPSASGRAGPPQAAQAGNPLGLSILLAEDHPVNAGIAGAMLNNIGCDHVWVQNGPQAIDALQMQHFDIVLMDCQMPEVDAVSPRPQGFASRSVRACCAGSRSSR